MIPQQENYTFDWGHVTEQKRGDFVIWEYCFTQLLDVYLAQGKGLSDLQQEAFTLLEENVIHTTRDLSILLGMNHGWMLVPSNHQSTFYLVSHFSQEKTARQWTVDCLLFDTIPKIVESLADHVEC